MKIRIKGNSLRLRLSQTDVRTLAKTGLVTEAISFGNTNIIYELRTSPHTNRLQADFLDSIICVFISEDFARSWDKNNIVGIDDKQDIVNGSFLTLLAEKDFQCVDETAEDQSDNYANPNTNC